MKFKVCPKCKWKFIELHDKICGYCKANVRLGINPIVISQNKNDKPHKDLSNKEIDLLIKKLTHK